MARVEVPMPQMGESIAEGTVSVWLKKVGDQVGRDEPIMEIATDKVDAEIPSPVAGTLAEVTVSEGETVEVGTIVAYIETEAAEGAAAAPAAAPAPAAQKEAAPSPAPAAAAPPAAPSAAPAAAAKPGSLEERLRTRSSPLVRRIAAENGVEVSAVNGTGRMGRVTKDDILAFVEHRPAGAAAPAAPPARKPARATEPGDAITWDDFYHEVQSPAVTAGPNDRVEPVSRMTQIIAENMVLSRRISPHVHSYFEVDYTRIDRVRAQNRRVWEEQGAKVTYTHFIAWAICRALREHPKLNASLSSDQVIYRSDVNLGIAVALDNGLIVPVVKNADELSLVGLAKRVNDVATRARTKKLSPEEIQGGTFTITNPGIFGTTIGFPIINQPQVAILGVGGVEMRPAVVQDEFGGHAIVARKRGYISLGYDHRLVNGADGDQFLARVKELMQTFPENA
ncbi:MAG TPA: dihydrolipoamide acetyltransferase family protein [Longimicrobiaceae bacterium]|nr:dihydrolipoamide acetyltransferase family protein [Longimicrobiaceae bacterium]